jgi:hypothetical protein
MYAIEHLAKSVFLRLLWLGAFWRIARGPSELDNASNDSAAAEPQLGRLRHQDKLSGRNSYDFATQGATPHLLDLRQAHFTRKLQSG